MTFYHKFFPAFFAVATLIFISSFLSPITARAQTTISDQYTDIQDQGIIFANICDSSVAPCECRDEGKCSLSDLLQVLVNLSVFILAISGSVMLLMFVYGGFMWITSQGKTERVEKGKQAMIGAVVGLVIVFGAYAAINIILSVLKTGTLPEGGQNIEDTIGDSSVIETE